MAKNIAPLLLGAGALYLLMSGKKGNGAPAASGGFSTDAGGTSPCHLLEGIWAPAMPAAQSGLSGITSNAKLLSLPLTPEGFQKADSFMLSYSTANPELDKDIVVFQAEKHLTEGMDCPWGQPTQWTPRMSQVHNALNVLYDEAVKQYGA
jgi:hypothetical protein